MDDLACAEGEQNGFVVKEINIRQVRHLIKDWLLANAAAILNSLDYDYRT